MRIIIFANGVVPSIQKVSHLLHTNDFFICADGGMKHALELGITPDVLLGDLDSLPIDFDLVGFPGEVLTFPQDKNETDLELALQKAQTLCKPNEPNSVVIIGALGGRLDHSLGNLALLYQYQQHFSSISFNDGSEEVFLCQSLIEIHGSIGETISLIPWQGDVHGISTKGLRWELDNETLYHTHTRGISNEFICPCARVSIQKGVLLIVKINHAL